MADLFGNNAQQTSGEAVLLKFLFRCWNDDPQQIVQHLFDKVDIEVRAESFEQALTRVRELVKRDHHEIIKIREF